MKTNSALTAFFLQKSSDRFHWNPIPSLTFPRLMRHLDDFHRGKLQPAVQIWETIERRDDLLPCLIAKRVGDVKRRDWEIVTSENSPEAMQQKIILEQFYNNLTCVNAYDQNERGGLPLLIRQMMNAIGKRYAVHEIVFRPFQQNGEKFLTAEFRFVPLFFFENIDGRLHFVADDACKTPLEPNEWLITTGDGLMEACSIAYLFKHLSLRDWLIYCERNGMPGVKGITQARPGSPEWEIAREAVQNFGAEFHALMSAGTDIQAIDISGKGELPYPKLIERMDRVMSALWRGSDLTTLSQEHGTGVTHQRTERDLLGDGDAQMISDTFNEQVDRYVLQTLTGTNFPKAYVKLKPSLNKNLNNDLAILRTLWEMGVPMSINDIREHFGINPPENKNDTIQRHLQR